MDMLIATTIFGLMASSPIKVGGALLVLHSGTVLVDLLLMSSIGYYSGAQKDAAPQQLRCVF
jgi:hypothetical protein